MKVKTALAAAALAASMILSAPCGAAPTTYHQALSLFEHGMYVKAMELFEKEASDPLCQDYAVLCAIRLGLPESGRMVAHADTSHQRTVLNSQIHYEWGLALFDAGEVEAASEHFSMVQMHKLSKVQKGEFLYKRGTSELAMGNVNSARKDFEKVCDIKGSAYVGASRFSLGTIAYGEHFFTSAIGWFELAKEDPRFESLSDFYLVDCHFMQKDYRYVIENGERIFPDLQDERKKHISRLVSESYLVLGDAQKAKTFLQTEDTDLATMTDYDLFHAASVLYATKDYAGALPYFEAMTTRADSLGQIASYQMGASYIEVKNKVAALEAFRAAALQSYDSDIQEDAFFNYAKLAFDLNNDSSVFKRYIEQYSTSKKGEVIYGYMALTALAQKDYSAAVEAYDMIDELTPEQKANYVKANYLRAEQLVSRGSYRDAVQYLKATSYYLPRTDQFSQLTRFQLADAYYRTGQMKEALSVLTDLYNTSALRGRTEGALVTYNIAYCHFTSGDYPVASRWFDTYLKTSDKAARKDALLRKADCEYVQKHYSNAAASYQGVIIEYPDQNDLYANYQLGMTCGLMGDNARKISALEPVKNAPRTALYYTEALYELANAYVQVGNENGALEAYSTLRKSSKDSTMVAKATLGMGLAKRNAGKYDESVALYEQVVKTAPGSEYAADALLAIQSIRQAQGRPELYLEYLEANNLNVGKTEAQKEKLYFSTAEQVFMAGNYSGAVAAAQRYIAKYPQGENVGDAFYYIAESHKQLGDKESALDNFQKSIDISSGGTYANLCRLNIAAISYSLERFADAYSAYETLDNPLGMMRSAYRARLYDEAIASAARLLTLASTDDALRRECEYVQAKSYLTTSRREEAFILIEKLCGAPDTAEGAEACVLRIQSRYDWAKFEEVETLVYDFAENAGGQNYWLARAYIILGDSFRERGNTEQARVTYESVRDGYEPAEGTSDDILEIVTSRLGELEADNINE